jgi:phosphopantothenoylcysteine synthetase/decarboxylase
VSSLACITCGPAYEPVDAVRRITNFSTGEIGFVLAEAFLCAGFDVVCFRGEGATWPPHGGADVRMFSTNDSLASGLRALDRQPAVVLHAAALCDFFVESIEGSVGSAKLESRSGRIRLTLAPAAKILPELRKWFPGALIVGWKYELDGDRDAALLRAARQIREAGNDACVVNGSAYGAGFGLVDGSGRLAHFPDKPSLARHLASMVRAA